MIIRVNINTEEDVIDVFCDDKGNELYEEIICLIGDYIYEKEHRENTIGE